MTTSHLKIRFHSHSSVWYQIQEDRVMTATADARDHLKFVWDGGQNK
jgi:hypothetical protein